MIVLHIKIILIMFVPTVLMDDCPQINITIYGVPHIAPIIVKPQIRYDDKFQNETLICGSVIIGTQWTLSSGTCLQVIRKYEFEIADLVIKSNVYNWESTMIDEPVVLHPVVNYYILDELGVAALFKVDKPFFTDIIGGIAISGRDFKISRNDNLFLLGYGGLLRNKARLRFVAATLEPESFCRYELGRHTFCLIPTCLESDSRICFGDKGGPIIVKRRTDTVLVGLINSEACEYQHQMFTHIYAKSLVRQLEEFSWTVGHIRGLRVVNE